jgi:hypothetical protein
MGVEAEFDRVAEAYCDLHKANVAVPRSEDRTLY